MKKTLINGPINVARLEGTIYGIKKIIYLFMDYHNEVFIQSQCDTLDSIDVSKYIVNNINNSNKKIQQDIFFETGIRDIGSAPEMPRGRYIDEVNRIFKKYDSDKKLSKNARYHYIDIRDYLYSEVGSILYNIATIQSKWFWNHNISNLQEYTQVLDNYNKLHVIVKHVYDAFNDKNKNKNKNKNTNTNTDNNTTDFNKVKYFIDKLKHKYKHSETKKQLSIIIDRIKKYFKKIIKILEKIKLLFDENREILLIDRNKLNARHNDYGTKPTDFIKFTYKLKKQYYKLQKYILFGYALIVDLFFLRRFIDKDNITNAVVYSGSMHSHLYIYMLCKYYGFTMTHVAYINNKYKKEKLADYYRDMTLYDIYVDTINIFYRDTLVQCSDLSHFPPNFE